jgi:hypothetical protein
MASRAQAVSHVSKDVVGRRERAPEEWQDFEVPLLLVYLKMEDS